MNRLCLLCLLCFLSPVFLLAQEETGEPPDPPSPLELRLSEALELCLAGNLAEAEQLIVQAVDDQLDAKENAFRSGSELTLLAEQCNDLYNYTLAGQVAVRALYNLKHAYFLCTGHTPPSGEEPTSTPPAWETDHAFLAKYYQAAINLSSRFSLTSDDLESYDELLGYHTAQLPPETPPPAEPMPAASPSEYAPSASDIALDQRLNDAYDLVVAGNTSGAENLIENAASSGDTVTQNQSRIALELTIVATRLRENDMRQLALAVALLVNNHLDSAISAAGELDYESKGNIMAQKATLLNDYLGDTEQANAAQALADEYFTLAE